MVLIKISRDQRSMNASVQQGIGMAKAEISQVLCGGQLRLGVFSTGVFPKECRTISSQAWIWVLFGAINCLHYNLEKTSTGNSISAGS